MENQEKPEGAFILWKWEDQEIDNLKRLRRQLLDIHSKGFSGVLASLGSTRYEFIDPKVLRAVAQVSQWAKKRNIAFWFETDPRQASRSLISKTGECTQNLIITKRRNDGLKETYPHISKIKKNRFELRFEYPKTQSSSLLQERSIHFEPIGLEKTYLFQMKGSTVISDSVRDITSESHFFANIEKGYVDIFGDVQTAEDEEWWAMAFPKFNTNVYDYAGFESNNLLCLFAENLFDACTHLSGIAWGENGTGYVVDMGRFPVSLSLYNSFRAEYRYDLRNVLYGLVLNLDSGLHIQIRSDYYNLLMHTVYNAEKEFYQTIHGFFGNLDVIVHHHFRSTVIQMDNLVRGSIDPWKSLNYVGSPIVEIEPVDHLKKNSYHLIPTILITKSLGVYSNTQRVFCDTQHSHYASEGLNYLMDLMALFSIRLLIKTNGNNMETHKKIPIKKDNLSHMSWNDMEGINRKINHIRNITGYKFPEANIVLVYPIETIMAMGSQDAEKIIASVNQLITRLVLAGIQLDVISPVLLKECHLFPDGISIRSRTYESIIFPYPEVVDHEVLEIISLIARSNIPFSIGGCVPRYTSSGKRVPHIFPLTFDPQDEDLSPLRKKGIKRLMILPENGLGTMIYQGEDILFLICPKQAGESVNGRVRFQNISFSVPKSQSLVIFRKQKYKKVEQIV
ncbi:hypothetical protein JW824_04020 [bacterium]|nr:hypothetical protein [bacterium]